MKTYTNLYNKIASGRIKVTTASHYLYRFWSKVNKNGFLHPDHGRCWEWLGKPQCDGYCRISIGNKQHSAHRTSYEIHKGRIKNGLHVLHKCDNRKCVNPYHLFLGTGLDNQRDCIAKGRNTFGARNKKSKLSEEAVRDIRKRHKLNSRTGMIKVLAAEYNVSERTIQNAFQRRFWRHVV